MNSNSPVSKGGRLLCRAAPHTCRFGCTCCGHCRVTMGTAVWPQGHCSVTMGTLQRDHRDTAVWPWRTACHRGRTAGWPQGHCRVTMGAAMWAYPWSPPGWAAAKPQCLGMVHRGTCRVVWALWNSAGFSSLLAENWSCSVVKRNRWFHFLLLKVQPVLLLLHEDSIKDRI